jgi:hypothetical protein
MTTAIDTPETAMLDYLVRIAEAVPGATALHAAVRDLATALHVEGALSCLSSAGDARLAAATIAEAAWRPTIPSPHSASEPRRCVPGAGTAPTPKASPRRSTAPRACWTSCEREWSIDANSPSPPARQVAHGSRADG